ncbi:MAG TPA: hypothetical protein V6C82_05665 [Chroococcales cyanobacterium]|jgi:osmotically-inducible protein OsmY
MIKHGHSPTTGEYTAVSSFVDPLSNREERPDYKTDDELTLEAVDLLMNADVPLNGLRIITNNAVIKVSGRIPRKDAKRQIETLLNSISGLTVVELDLVVDENLKVDEAVEKE